MMEYKYTYGFDEKCFWYIYLIVNNDKFSADDMISNFFEMPIKTYQKMLTTKFNGIMKNYSFAIGVFFNEEEDCQNAIKYLYEITDSYLVTKELAGK